MSQMFSHKFVSTNQEQIKSLENELVNTIKSLNIDLNQDLTTGSIIKIIGEIGKTISNSKNLMEQMKDFSDNDKTAIFSLILIKLLDSDKIQNLFSSQQKSKIKGFVNDTNTINTIINLIDWVADESLKRMDKNDDGKVSLEEIEKYHKNLCCGCCSNKCISCWSIFVKKILCCKCSSKEINYN